MTQTASYPVLGWWKNIGALEKMTGAELQQGVYTLRHPVYLVNDHENLVLGRTGSAVLGTDIFDRFLESPIARKATP